MSFIYDDLWQNNIWHIHRQVVVLWFIRQQKANHVIDSSCCQWLYNNNKYFTNSQKANRYHLWVTLTTNNEICSTNSGCPQHHLQPGHKMCDQFRAPGVILFESLDSKRLSNGTSSFQLTTWGSAWWHHVCQRNLILGSAWWHHVYQKNT